MLLCEKSAFLIKIICKISDEHFIATTTTGGAANVLACMEEYAQTEWPNLKVYMNSITEDLDRQHFPKEVRPAGTQRGPRDNFQTDH